MDAKRQELLEDEIEVVAWIFTTLQKATSRVMGVEYRLDDTAAMLVAERLATRISTSPPAVEQRLLQLSALHTKGLVTDAEYAAKRTEISADL